MKTHHRMGKIPSQKDKYNIRECEVRKKGCLKCSNFCFYWLTTGTARNRTYVLCFITENYRCVTYKYLTVGMIPGTCTCAKMKKPKVEETRCVVQNWSTFQAKYIFRKLLACLMLLDRKTWAMMFMWLSLVWEKGFVQTEHRFLISGHMSSIHNRLKSNWAIQVACKPHCFVRKMHSYS